MSQEKLNNIKNSGFKVPDGYFDALDDTLFTQAKLKASITDSGFTVPDNYLESIEDKILNQISTKNTTKVINLFSRKNMLYASSVAAAIVLMFSLYTPNQKPTTIDNLDNETVENYLLDEDLDLYEIASVLTIEDLTEENFNDVKIDEATFEDYILSDVDLESIMTE